MRFSCPLLVLRHRLLHDALHRRAAGVGTRWRGRRGALTDLASGDAVGAASEPGLQVVTAAFWPGPSDLTEIQP